MISARGLRRFACKLKKTDAIGNKRFPEMRHPNCTDTFDQYFPTNHKKLRLFPRTFKFSKFTDTFDQYFPQTITISCWCRIVADWCVNGCLIISRDVNVFANRKMVYNSINSYMNAGMGGLMNA